MQFFTFRFQLLVLLLLTTILCATFTEPAFAARRGRSNAASAAARRASTIKAAQAQYTAAQNVLSAAQSTGAGAQARLQAVLGEMNSSAMELRKSRSASHEIEQDLTEIEEDILTEQGPKTPYYQLNEQVHTTKDKLAAAEKRLTETPDFLRKAEQVKGVEGAAAAFRLRQTTLENDTEYSILKTSLADFSEKRETLKRELFHKDKEWQEAHAKLATAHKSEREAATDLYGSAKDRAEPKEQIKTAAQAANAARATMAQAEQILKQMGASPTPAKTASGSTKTKK